MLVWHVISSYIILYHLILYHNCIIVSYITPNLPTKIVPTNIARLKLSGKSPMDVRIPPLQIKIMLESDPPKSTMLVGRLGVS